MIYILLVIGLIVAIIIALKTKKTTALHIYTLMCVGIVGLNAHIALKSQKLELKIDHYTYVRVTTKEYIFDFLDYALEMDTGDRNDMEKRYESFGMMASIIPFENQINDIEFMGYQMLDDMFEEHVYAVEQLEILEKELEKVEWWSKLLYFK